MNQDGSIDSRQWTLVANDSAPRWAITRAKTDPPDGWAPKPGIAKLGFEPPLQPSPARHLGQFLAYAPIDSDTYDEKQKMATLNEVFGGAQGTFNWRGKKYGYALTLALPCFPLSGDNSNPVVAHSANLQSLDHGRSPVTEGLPTFTPSTTPPPAIAAARNARNSRLRHQRRIKTQDVTRSANARPPGRRAGPVMTASKSLTAPATLSPNIATAKGPPSARMSHRRGRTSRAFVSSAKPQPSDHRSDSVTGALLDTGPPGELPATTLVH